MQPCALAAPRLALLTCPRCTASNLEYFRFCQLCGWQRPLLGLPSALENVDWVTVHEVAAQFADAADATQHHQKQDAVYESFQAFCASLCAPFQPCHAASASPAVVCHFLAYRATHSSGTLSQLHAQDCPQLGTCECPRRMKFTTLEKLLGALRRELNSQCGLGLTYGTEASSSAACGNPAAAPRVVRWVAEYTKHQKRAGVSVQQAVPITREDSKRVITCIDSQLFGLQMKRPAPDVPVLDAQTRQYFELLRLKSFFAVDGRTGQRGGDLIQTLCARVASFPDNDGFLFGWTSGKTFRDAHMFGMEADAGDVTCGCAALRQYTDFCTSILKWDMSTGYLWPAVVPTGPLTAARKCTYFDVSAASKAFSALVQLAGIQRHITLSGYRSGVAIRNALSGESLMAGMEKSYWRTNATALHYIKLFEVLSHSGLKRNNYTRGISEQELQRISELPLTMLAAFRST